MKTRILSLCFGLGAAALLWGAVPRAQAQAQPVVHIAQDFESYSLGSLTSGNGWSISANVAASIVDDPVYQGNRALEFRRNGAGALTYTTNGGPNTPLVLAEDKSYAWSFAFYIGADTPASDSAGAYIYLDTGAAASTFASLNVRYVQSLGAYRIMAYNNLGGDAFSAANYVILGTVSGEQWHTAEFLLSINEDSQISYTLNVGSLSHTVVAQESRAGFADNNYVRMVVSPQINGTVMAVDNLYLATLPAIPEPAVTALLAGAGALLLCVLRSRRLRSGVLRFCSLGALLALFGGAGAPVAQAAEASAPAYTNADSFTIQTDGFSTVVRPIAAFTLGAMRYEGVPVGTGNGNNGFVVAYDGLKFIGSGHREGGYENVQSVVLKVDGKVVEPLPLGKTVAATEAELTKVSKLGDDIELHSVTLIRADSVVYKNTMKVINNTHLSKVYPLMFMWPATTTEYLAGLTSGGLAEGTFDNKGWEINDHARWVATYEPQREIAMLTVFPEDMPRAGKGARKHTIWDTAAYHKQYFMFADREDFTAGDVFVFEADIRAVRGTPANWQANVKAVAGQLGAPVL